MPVYAFILSLNSVLNVEALVGAFKQEKALVGALSVIVKSSRILVLSSALHTTKTQLSLLLSETVDSFCTGRDIVGRCSAGAGAGEAWPHSTLLASPNTDHLSQPRPSCDLSPAALSAK